METSKQQTSAQQITNYLNGQYDSPDFKTQCAAGWYDWFCKQSSLVKKTDKLYKLFIQISKSKKIDLLNSCVFFKNNCPMNGSLYDDFRICDLTNGDVIYTIIPKSGHKNMNGKGEVWGKENNFKEALFVGTWHEIKNFFLNS